MTLSPTPLAGLFVERRKHFLMIASKMLKYLSLPASMVIAAFHPREIIGIVCILCANTRISKKYMINQHTIRD